MTIPAAAVPWLWASLVFVLLTGWLLSRATETFDAAVPEEAQPAAASAASPGDLAAKYADEDRVAEIHKKYNDKPREPYTAAKDLDKAPRFWIGSAFDRANHDFVTYPDEWTFVRRNAGMFVHPMGWTFLTQTGRRQAKLVGSFRKPWFTYLENINAAVNPDRPVLYHYDQVKKINPAMQCAGVYVYVTNSMLLNETKYAAERFRKYTAKLRELGIPYFLICTPMDDDYLDKYLAPYEGEPLWTWFCKYTGASALAIDYPIGHYNMTRPNQFVRDPEKARQLAIKMAQTTQAAGLKFIWVLNGYVPKPYTLAEVRQFVLDLRKVQVFPDWWLVDQFREEEFPGTPECGKSVSGQLKALMVMDRPLDGPRPKVQYTRPPTALSLGPDCPTPRPEGLVTVKSYIEAVKKTKELTAAGATPAPGVDLAIITAAPTASPLATTPAPLVTKTAVKSSTKATAKATTKAKK